MKGLVNILSKNILIKKEAFRPLLEKAVLDTITLMYQPSAYFISEFKGLPNVTRIQGMRGLSKYIKHQKTIYNQIIEKIDNDGKQVITDDELTTLVQFVTGRNGIIDDEIEKDQKEFESISPIDFLEKIEPEPSPEPEPVIPEADPEVVSDKIEDKGITIDLEDEKEQEELGTIIIEKDELDELDKGEPDEEEGITIDTDDYEESDDAENMDEEFAPIDEEPEEEDPKEIINEQFSEPSPTINEQFEKEKSEATVAEVRESESVSEIQKSINVNQRYMFLNDLFGSDEAVYSQALNEVESSNSFDESVELLVQRYSKKFEWDMNSDEVKELLKVIFKRFR